MPHQSNWLRLPKQYPPYRLPDPKDHGKWNNIADTTAFPLPSPDRSTQGDSLSLQPLPNWQSPNDRVKIRRYFDEPYSEQAPAWSSRVDCMDYCCRIPIFHPLW